MGIRRRWILVVSSLATLALVVSLSFRPLAALDTITSLKSTLDLVVRLVQTDYKDSVDPAKLWQGAIKGVMETLNDPYSVWFPPSDLKDFQSQLSGNYEGIGIFIDFKDHYLTVVRPIPGSPAEKAGLQTGDQITAVDGVSLRDVPAEEASSRIKGPAGTSVHLRIHRPSTGADFEVDIVRASIVIPVVETKMLTRDMGYIHLEQFTGDASSRFDAAVSDLKAQGAQGLVIDLRGNPGGYLDQVVRIASRFIPPGKPVIWTVNKSGKEALNSIPATPVGVPTVFLVDNASASASEILAGAIQDYGVAPVVGIKTFGKGTVQEILNFTDGSGMKLTIDEYLTPNQHHVHGIGITPDVIAGPYKGADERTKALTWDRMLYRGVVGLDVLYAQERLNDLGYGPVHEDGYFEAGTMAAVQALQKAGKLPVTGLVDKATLDLLNQRVTDHEAEMARTDPPLTKAEALLQARLTARSPTVGQ